MTLNVQQNNGVSRATQRQLRSQAKSIFLIYEISNKKPEATISPNMINEFWTALKKQVKNNTDVNTNAEYQGRILKLFTQPCPQILTFLTKRIESGKTVVKVQAEDWTSDLSYTKRKSYLQATRLSLSNGVSAEKIFHRTRMHQKPTPKDYLHLL